MLEAHKNSIEDQIKLFQKQNQDNELVKNIAELNKKVKLIKNDVYKQ